MILLAGPTASGKSQLAIDLAKRINGEVINADALQVYSDLSVISARPRDNEMQGVVHHMFGHIDGGHRYSTGQWLREASEVILDVLARGRIPIVVGGTGLYFKALTQGLANVPAVDMARTQEFLDKNGIAALRELAESLDPIATARVLGNDPQRLLRIASVAQQTGASLSQWQANTHPVVPRGYWHGAILLPPRDVLYSRINARFETMVQGGGLREVKALAARRLPMDLPVMRAIGVKTLVQYLAGEHSLEAGIELAKRDTRRFAKRQMTWLRGQTPDWPKLETKSDIDRFIEQMAKQVSA